MVRVFLSHSSQDKPFVRMLADELETGGEIKVWLDEREIGYGENIVLKIEEGLDANVVLLILSPDSVDSKWVKEEWTAAYWEQVNSQHTKFAGVLYRDCQLPRLLANKSYFDLRTNQTEGFRKIKTWLLGQRPPVPPVVHLPQRSPLFIGREPEIEDLRRRLKEPGSVAYVAGLAGRGKTTLALEYAHRYQRDYEAVHWLPCQSRTLVQIAGELAWQLGLKLEGDLDTIVRELNGHCARKRCLLIFDNVEDDTPARLLPAGRTSVLITTRFNTLRFLRAHQPLNLPLFTEEQCFELFSREIGKDEVEKHQPEARSLFQRLGYLPIGIAVAASLIREDVRYTIAGIAKNLPADVTALLREAVTALSPTAQTLLAAMAVCAPEGFRLALAAEVAELDETTSLDALQEIYARSLAEELDRDERRYRLHALVRESAGATDAQRQKHAESLRKEFENWEKDWRQCEKDMADWQMAFSWSLSQLRDDKAWSLSNSLGYLGYELIRRLGRLPEAYEICERMAQEANRRGTKPALRAWYGNQALILQDWGQLERAMRLFENVEAISVELDDRDSLRRSYGNRALILRIWGDLDEAMELHRKEEDICGKLNIKDGLQLSYGNQAMILKAWGRLDEALEL
jgi:tetratricopeptide (TPR) repeat protein